jgi:mono/diheme cytochrome c family protein
MTNCVVCHNPNPNLPGSQGPPIAGSSRELIEDRVLYLKYPPGYKPKRTTHAMRAMPFLKNQIDNLYAFLQEAALQQPATAAK